MLISEKTTGRFIIFFFFFFLRQSVSDRQLEKNNGQKSASESSEMREKQILGP